MSDDYDRQYAIAVVSEELSRAWALLSQEKRAFALAPAQDAPPPHAEFSFMIPMTIQSDASTFTVGVLIQRADACTVACAMFGSPPEDVSQDDLADACSEVCNIFSASIGNHLYYGQTVMMGLPLVLSEAAYTSLLSEIGSGDIYQSQRNGHILSVIVFGHASSR